MRKDGYILKKLQFNNSTSLDLGSSEVDSRSQGLDSSYSHVHHVVTDNLFSQWSSWEFKWLSEECQGNLIKCFRLTLSMPYHFKL